jgi:hypothetical protein
MAKKKTTGRGRCGCRLVVNGVYSKAEYPLSANGWASAKKLALKTDGTVDLACGKEYMILYHCVEGRCGIETNARPLDEIKSDVERRPPLAGHRRHRR